jgi:GDPmannose 4,6-dehydratase
MKKALITGITGQDGSYLAELLISKNYEVHGIVRHVALEDPSHRMWRLRKCIDKIHFHSASIENYPSIISIVEKIRPDECYHLAAQSFVSYLFEDEFSIINTNINGTHFILSAIRQKAPQCRFYFASSSELFGRVSESPQTEKTPFHPRSFYGISKVAGFDLTRNYRESLGIHASSGILFNHESPRRGFEFITRKITSHAVQIKLGMKKEIRVGNIEAKRDWGHAKDYVKAMWSMLQQKEPDDYVISTGVCHSVKDFLSKAFSHLGLNYQDYLIIDENFYRPAEDILLKGDSTKAKEKLGWNSETSFDDLVVEMVEADLAHYKNKV